MAGAPAYSHRPSQYQHRASERYRGYGQYVQGGQRPGYGRYSGYSDYNYGTAAPQLRPERRPDISVIPGRGAQPALDPRVRVLLRVVVAIALILAVAGVVRVGFTNAAVAANIANEELSMDVNAARAEAGELEVQASNLSNPAYVREYASTKLGMQAPETVETLTLGEDVVVTDGDGALSLSGSLAAVARG